MFALMLGFLLPGGWWRAWQVSAAASLAWFALAFVANGRSHGLIVERVGALFSLPSPWLLLLLMAAIGGLTALVNFISGVYLRSVVDNLEAEPGL